MNVIKDDDADEEELYEMNEVPEEGKRLKIPDFWKGILTVIGAMLVNFAAGSIFGVLTLVVYQISHIKNEGNNISLDNMTFYYPLESLFQCIFSFVSGYFEKKIGLHLTNVIGFFFLGSGYLILFFSYNFYIDILSIIIIGIGTGILYYPSTKNACLWFKNHKGIIIGILETMISLGSFFSSSIGELIINKENKSSDVDGIYDQEIEKKFKTFLIIQIIVVFTTFFISFLLMFTKKEKEKTDIIIYNELEQIEFGSSQDDKTNIISNSKKSIFSKKIVKNIYKKKLATALKSKILILKAIITVLGLQGPSMIFSLYRTIGETEKIETKTLRLIGPHNFIFECLSGIIGGVLCQFVNINLLLIITNAINTAFISTYCLTFRFSTAFFWSTNLVMFFKGITYPLDDFYFMKVFGSDIYIELISYTNFFSCFFMAVFSFFVYLIQRKYDETIDYWIIFSFFGVLNFISFVLCFFVNSQPFNYEKKIGLISNTINNQDEDDIKDLM